MAKVTFRQKAIDDLTDIWEYTVFHWSENQADIYYSSIQVACAEIGLKPNIGKKYTGINPNLLGFKAGKHIIFYHEISENEIEIIRILHESMDIKNRMVE